MNNKLEMIEKLTGIRSSRKNYYTELNEMIKKMKIKNKQLEVMNQLTRIHVNLSWEEVVQYIAQQLHPVISFDIIVLTLAEREHLALYITEIENGQATTRSIPNVRVEKESLSIEKLQSLLNMQFPHYQMNTVFLPSYTENAYGSLTLLNQEPIAKEAFHFFKSVAEYAGTSIENIRLYKDVCEKVKIEAQLIQSAKLAAIGEMAAGVAHELNSPLTAILGNTQLLLRESHNERFQNMLQDVYQCGLRSKRIIQNLLTFSKQDEYRFEDLYVHMLIDEVCSLIGYQLKVSGIQVERVLSPSLPTVKGSRYQIEQVLINLLLNARDAVQDREEPEIRIETGLMDWENQTFVKISVFDNGCGIKEEHLSKIFNPFFTTKETQKGTGLGLSVSLGIAQSHHGTMVVDSKEGEFSNFTLLLPVPREKEVDL